MDEPHPTSGCVFCGRPLTADQACPLLASSHWACCACPAPAAAADDAA
jgi:hypothetical protein